MAQSDSRKDLVIIGGGVGGLNIASAAAQLGLKTCLVEQRPQLGGDCLHFGCVPSKTLLHQAKLAKLKSTITPNDITDLANINKHIQNIIAKLQQHDSPERFRSYGCEVIFGQPQFVHSKAINVNGQTITAKRFVIATGSSPRLPPIQGLTDINYLTNETIFKLKTLPQRLIIIGAGAIGLEMAQAFARLGSNVTVLETLPKPVAQGDTEVTTKLVQCLQDEGVQIHCGVEIRQIVPQQQMALVKFLKRDLQTELTVHGDALLLAVGRVANIAKLGLDAAQVKYCEAGIQVDSRLRTSAKHIYAVGDVVAGAPKFTHIAEYHAGIVIANAIFHLPRKVNYRIAPWVVFTDPEYAQAGLTEQQARSQGKNVEVVQLPLANIDRAQIENMPDGIIKLVICKGKPLGIAILAPAAGELLAEWCLALQTGASLRDITNTIHAYPTLAQANRRVVNAYYGPKLFNPKVKKFVKWLNRLF